VPTPLDRAEFERWRAEAASASETAALARRGGSHAWSCFLSEQAAQLAVKGLLHGLGSEAWGHDLTLLGARAAELLGDAWPADLRDVAARLSRHYIPTRYPDAHAAGAPSSHYTDLDAAQAAADAARVFEAIDAAWVRLGGTA
jgi:HEPN domain-containing protein